MVEELGVHGFKCGPVKADHKYRAERLAGCF